jgi:Starch-binding associating with outer membrane
MLNSKPLIIPNIIIMRSYKYLLLLLLPVATIVSCKKSTFVDANINPSTLTSVDPGSQFLYASQHFYSDFEGYYDFLRFEGPWMQLWTGGAGNGGSFNAPTATADYRYGNFYGNVGLALTDIPHLVEKMPAADQTARVYELAIASIAKAYYAFYTSDVNGSIAYSQAFLGRYGGTLTPTYDPQQPLFDSLDLQVKTAVATLEASQPVTQVLYGGNDPFYGGSSTEAMQWIKAGNALRLKMAMRLMKRDPTTLASIATSVLADANQMSSIADSWVLYAGPAFASATGNFNPTGFLAPQPVVNFMLANSDPRLRIFYRPNNIGNYLGSPTNPDTCLDAYYVGLYKNSLDTFSTLQHRMFTPAFDEGDGNGAGTGQFFMPMITYAEYCFIRAELGARGITTDNAGTWYTAGVTASINFYSLMGKNAGISNFTVVAPSEITTYLGMPAVTFNASKAVEQIACQAYLDFFRQPSEAWAWWKRTGFPNTTSVLAWSPLTYQGTTLPLPRRVALTVLSADDANYANQAAAYTAMEQDAGFGTPDNAFGRVWWDQQ